MVTYFYQNLILSLELTRQDILIGLYVISVIKHKHFPSEEAIRILLNVLVDTSLQLVDRVTEPLKHIPGSIRQLSHGILKHSVRQLSHRVLKHSVRQLSHRVLKHSVRQLNQSVET